MHGTSFRQTIFIQIKKTNHISHLWLRQLGPKHLQHRFNRGHAFFIFLSSILFSCGRTNRECRANICLFTQRYIGNLLFQVTNSYTFAQTIKYSVLLPVPIAETYRMFILAQLFHIFSYLRLAKVNKIFNAANFYIEKHRSASYNLKTSFPKAQR